MAPKIPENMQYEDERLDTFTKSVKISGSSHSKYWANDRPDKVKLAENGFFFTPSTKHPDQVTCACCSKKEHNINEVDDVVQYHLSNNHKCALSTIIFNLAAYIGANNPDGFWSSQSEKRLSDPLSKESIELRKKTFKGFWKFDALTGSSATSKSLASAGFYYSPKEVEGDRVFCMYCGCSLEGWDQHDEPLKEHISKGDKGCYFISKYSQAHDKSEKLASTTQGRQKRKKPPTKVTNEPPRKVTNEPPREVTNEPSRKVTNELVHKVSFSEGDHTESASNQSRTSKIEEIDDVTISKDSNQNTPPKIAPDNEKNASLSHSQSSTPKSKDSIPGEPSNILAEDPKLRRSRRIRNLSDRSKQDKVLNQKSADNVSLDAAETKISSLMSSAPGAALNNSSISTKTEVANNKNQESEDESDERDDQHISDHPNGMLLDYTYDEKDEENLGQSHKKQKESFQVASSFLDDNIDESSDRDYIPDSPSDSHLLSPQGLREGNKKTAKHSIQLKESEVGEEADTETMATSKIPSRKNNSRPQSQGTLQQPSKYPSHKALIPSAFEDELEATKGTAQSKKKTAKEGALQNNGEIETSKGTRAKSNSKKKSRKGTSSLEDTKQSSLKRSRDSDQSTQEENQKPGKKQPKKRKLKIHRTAYSPSPDFFDLSNQNIGDYDEMHVDFHENDLRPKAPLSPKKPVPDKLHKKDKLKKITVGNESNANISTTKHKTSDRSARRNILDSSLSEEIFSKNKNIFDAMRDTATVSRKASDPPASPRNGATYSSQPSPGVSLTNQSLHGTTEDPKADDELSIELNEDHESPRASLTHRNSPGTTEDPEADNELKSELNENHESFKISESQRDLSSKHDLSKLTVNTDKGIVKGRGSSKDAEVDVAIDFEHLGENLETEAHEGQHNEQNQRAGEEQATGKEDNNERNSNSWYENENSPSQNPLLEEASESMEVNDDYASASETFASPIPDILPSNISGSTDIDMVLDRQVLEKDIFGENSEQPRGRDSMKYYPEPLTVIDDSDSGEEGSENPIHTAEREVHESSSHSMTVAKTANGSSGSKEHVDRQGSNHWNEPEQANEMSDADSLSSSVYEEYVHGVNEFSRKLSSSNGPSAQEKAVSRSNRGSTKGHLEELEENRGLSSNEGRKHSSISNSKVTEKQEKRNSENHATREDDKTGLPSSGTSFSSDSKGKQKNSDEASNPIMSLSTASRQEEPADIFDTSTPEKTYKEKGATRQQEHHRGSSESRISTKPYKEKGAARPQEHHSGSSESRISTKPYTIQNFEDELQTMSDTVQYLDMLPTSEYGLYNDIEGVITGFIAAMPEEEENMTIEEWIRHNAASCADTVRKHGEDMIESYAAMCDEMIKLVEAMPEH